MTPLHRAGVRANRTIWAGAAKMWASWAWPGSSATVTAGLVPSAELENAVKAITDMICANAPLTIQAVKYTVGEILKDEGKRNVPRTVEMVEKCFTSRDYNEGRSAFMEKRKPDFKGR